VPASFALPSAAAVPPPVLLQLNRSDDEPRVSTGTDSSRPINLGELEADAIQRALMVTGGNRTRAARLLGISERTLRNKLNIPPGDDRTASLA